MLKKRFYFFTILFSLSLFFVSAKVLAQVEENNVEETAIENSTESAEASIESEAKTDSKQEDGESEIILQKQRLAEEIETVRTTLRGQLEEYRAKEKLFIIAKDQYQKHQTLISIEEAVRATKDVLLIRNQVLSTYINLMRLRLIETDGIEIDQKQNVLALAQKLMDELENYKLALEKANDKDSINNLSYQFKALYERIENLSYQAKTLIQIGKLQNVYDRSILLYKQLEAEADKDNLTKTKKAELERAFDQTEELNKQNKEKLNQIWQQTSEKEKTVKDWTSHYQLISKESNKIYVNLSKTNSYLRELRIMQL
ncbi:MAG: hypothetical protein PVJ09_04895 [Candidatus Woesebacteria bacterium]